MTWVRLDDDFYNHPKVIKAGPLGIAMQVSALCYCNHYLTDGFIPMSAIPGLLNLDGIGMRMWSNESIGGGEDAAWAMIVEDLVNAGLWEVAEGGYRIHDYLEYQPSKAQVMAERAANAKRQEEWREKSKNTRNAVSNSVTNAVPNPVPNPLIPDANASGGANAPTANPSRSKLRFDSTPQGALMAQKLRSVFESKGRRPPEFFANAIQQTAYLTAFDALGSRLESLLDSAMESDITDRARLLKWLQGCAKRNGNSKDKPNATTARNSAGDRGEYTAEDYAAAERINKRRADRQAGRV